MITTPISRHLRTLVGSYRPEVMEEDEIPSYIQSISKENLAALRAEFHHLISEGIIDANFAYQTTGLEFSGSKIAISFFKALSDYLDGNGELPDIYDYAD